MKFTDAKHEGATDKTFEEKYNYLIDLLNKMSVKEIQEITNKLTVINNSVQNNTTNITNVENTVTNVENVVKLTNRLSYFIIEEDFISRQNGDGRFGGELALTSGQIGTGNTGFIKESRNSWYNPTHIGAILLGKDVHPPATRSGIHVSTLSTHLPESTNDATFNHSQRVTESERLTFIFRVPGQVDRDPFAGARYIGRFLTSGEMLLPEYGNFISISISGDIIGYSRYDSSISQTQNHYTISPNTWYKIVMTKLPNSGCNFKLYLSADTIEEPTPLLWEGNTTVNIVSPTRQNRYPIFAAQVENSTSTGTLSDQHMLIIDYYKYEILTELIR